MGATAAAIFLPDEEQRDVAGIFHTGTDVPAELQALLRQRIESFALSRALRDADAPLVLHRDDARRLLSPLAWSRIRARAVAAIPIRWQGRLMAALLVGFARPEEVGSVEIHLLHDLARQIALGMERLNLQGRVQEQQNQMAVVGERNRIARDLHDGIVQYVYALGLNLEHARDLLRQDPEGVPTILTQAIEQTNHVLSEMRTFIYQLRPIIMKEKEIGQWIADLCRQFQQATGIEVRAEIAQTGGRELSPEISIALFRIIQEALSNIYQHAQAQHGALTLEFQPEGVRLAVEDDGRGFNPQERPAPGIAGGHGLSNIEERVKDLGGELRLRSAPGQGTRLEASFPYSHER